MKARKFKPDDARAVSKIMNEAFRSFLGDKNSRAPVHYIQNAFVPDGYQKDQFKKGVDEIILGRFLKH